MQFIAKSTLSLSQQYCIVRINKKFVAFLFVGDEAIQGLLFTTAFVEAHFFKVVTVSARLLNEPPLSLERLFQAFLFARSEFTGLSWYGFTCRFEFVAISLLVQKKPLKHLLYYKFCPVPKPFRCR